MVILLKEWFVSGLEKADRPEKLQLRQSKRLVCLLGYKLQLTRDPLYKLWLYLWLCVLQINKKKSTTHQHQTATNIQLENSMRAS